MKNIFYFIIISSIILCSCEKKNITGNVIDNLGNYIENVNVSIKNTDFKTKTNKEGYFSLDYAPGEIDLVIEDSGYIGFEEHYVIYEKSKYPLGEINLVKIPENNGLFLILSNEYILLPKSIMYSKEKEKGSGWSTCLDISYFLDIDSIFNIKSSNNFTLKFFDYSECALKLVKVDSTLKAANFEIRMSSYKVITDYYDEEVKEITKDMIERTVTLKKGQVYAFLNIVDYKFDQKMSNVAYAFKIK